MDLAVVSDVWKEGHLLVVVLHRHEQLSSAQSKLGTSFGTDLDWKQNSKKKKARARSVL